MGYGDNREGRSKGDFQAISWGNSQEGDSPSGRKAFNKITVNPVIK